MPTVTIHDVDGRQIVAQAALSETLMEVARNAGAAVPGECGGACICGTCHVYIDSAWQAIVGAPSDIEKATMEFADNVGSASRLGCCILITSELDGLIVTVPAGNDDISG
jgi:2Fe-2S ferredoxin